MRFDIESLLTVVSASVISFFVSRVPAVPGGLLTGFVLVVCIAVAVFFLKELLMRSLSKNRFESKITADWIEYDKRSADSPFTIATIHFDHKRDSLKFSGYAYSREGEHVGTFVSKAIVVDEDREEFDYIFDGRVMEKGAREADIGFGNIRFNSPKNGVYRDGSGFFRGVGNDFQPVDHKLQRITRRMCMEYAGKEHLESDDDRRRFIIAFAQARQSA